MPPASVTEYAPIWGTIANVIFNRSARNEFPLTSAGSGKDVNAALPREIGRWYGRQERRIKGFLVR